MSPAALLEEKIFYAEARGVPLRPKDVVSIQALEGLVGARSAPGETTDD